MVKRTEPEKRAIQEAIRISNLAVSSGICWNLNQLMKCIEDNDSHNEMVKLEVVHGFEPGKKCYRWTIFKYAYDWKEDA